MLPERLRRSCRSRAFRVVCLVFWLPLSLALLAGCVTEPLTGRSQLQLIPEPQLNEMGLQGYQQILSEAKISDNPEYNAMITRVGERIAVVADRLMKEQEREPFAWEFKVVDAPEQVNAFALPGGKVAFYTGILPICQNDAGVAVVMGHEVAHAYARHGGARVSREAVSQVGLQAVMAALSSAGTSETSQLALAALGVGYQYGVALPFSRGDESDADKLGLLLMAEAGYDPREAPRFWKRMAEATGGGGAPPEFASTHPSHDTRIETLNELMPRALEVYRKSGR